MRVFYATDSYRSHLRAAEAYGRCLRRLGHVLVDGAENADVSIIHTALDKYERVFARYPALKDRPWIAYAVWETSALPPMYASALASAHAIWTASDFCFWAFAEAHPSVHVVPHVVDAPAHADAALVARVRRDLMLSEDVYVYLYITKLADRRKNTDALLKAFAAVHARHPATRLVLKTNERDPDVRADGVVQVRRTLSDAHVAALYGLAGAYVSPHRGEGWGLTLSDAMAHGVPAIATAFSGNLDFMNDANAWLVPCREAPANDPSLGDQSRGVWAEIDHEALVSAMMRVYEDTAAARAKAALGQRSMAPFHEARVAAAIADALRDR